MSDLLAARAQMGMSLAFHILFACAGIGMPLLMVLAEWRWLRRRDPNDLELAHRWAKGTAILFAVGAVSGTVLSFELGLLWPGFMRFAGPIIGMPFSLEGFAFFLEAIGLGLYLYGWKRLSPRVHLATGALVLAMGVASALFVVTANAWMNTPTGFTRDAAGVVVDVDVIAAMFNPAAPSQCLHMVLAAFAACGFAVAGIHAYRLRRAPEGAQNPVDRRALIIALAVGGVAACLQPFSGDMAAKQVAENQPVKLAAMEGHFETTRCAPLHLGGIPDEADRTTRFAIKIPCGLSFLAFGDFDAEVRGLNDFPRDLWPPVAATHLAFQAMVAAGFAMMGVAALAAFMAWRRRHRGGLPTQGKGGRRLLLLIMLTGPLGLIAVEAGWGVTELGRQPWIVQGIMKTADAVTPMPGLLAPFVTFTVLYLVLGVTVVVLLKRHVFGLPLASPASAPATPSEAP